MPKWESGRGRKPASATSQNDTNQTKQEKHDDSRAHPAVSKPLRTDTNGAAGHELAGDKAYENDTLFSQTIRCRLGASFRCAHGLEVWYESGAGEPRVRRYPFLELRTLSEASSLPSVPLLLSCLVLPLRRWRMRSSKRPRSARRTHSFFGRWTIVRVGHALERAAERGKFAGREAGDEARGQNARDGTACMMWRRRRDSAIVSAHRLSERELHVCSLCAFGSAAVLLGGRVCGKARKLMDGYKKKKKIMRHGTIELSCGHSLLVAPNPLSRGWRQYRTDPQEVRVKGDRILRKTPSLKLPDHPKNTAAPGVRKDSMSIENFNKERRCRRQDIAGAV
ncbi:hypothetical protein B0H13DRAFT_1858799 [Mycena leptocephala]|nr:hypothetical protein B0H13DRAFT_1858799 [Mycena leptocephala]